MNVLHSCSRSCLLFLALCGSSGGVVVYVCISLTVEIVKVHEGSRSCITHIRVSVKQIIVLGSNGGSRSQGNPVNGTILRIVVPFGHIGTVIIQPVNVLNVDVVLVPVGLICLEYDRILFGSIRHYIGTAVCNGIRSFTIEIIRCGRIKLCSEFTAFRLIEGFAHRCKDVIAKHSHEVAAGLLKGVYQCVIIGSFCTNLSEIGNTAVNVLRSILDHTFYQILQTALCIHHVLHSRYKVICCQVSHFSALGIYPLQTLTDMEGISQTILGNFITLCQCRLKNTFVIILYQTIIGIYQRLSLCLSGTCQNIPGRRICRITVVVLIFQSIAFLFQIFFSLCLVSAGSFQLCPFFSQCSYILSFDEIGSDQCLVDTILIASPKTIAYGMRSHSAQSVVTALGFGRKHNSRLHQFGFCLSHHGISLGNVGLLFCFAVQAVELTQLGIIDFRRSGGILIGNIVLIIVFLVCVLGIRIFSVCLIGVFFFFCILNGFGLGNGLSAFLSKNCHSRSAAGSCNSSYCQKYAY